MIAWDRLRVFAAVVEHGSVVAAAEALHITGPGVSQHVRKLEKEVRCQLVEPDGRGIRLTTAGQVLASSVRTIAATVADAERDLSNIHGQVVGPLRIGAVASALRALVPQVLQTLTAQHPQLEPTLRDGEIVELIPALRARRLDAVIIESWSNRPAAVPPGLQLAYLITEDAHLAVSHHHPLAHRPVVTLAELNDQVWTSCPPGTDAHEALVQTLRTHNAHCDVRYCVADYVSQLALVAADLAVAMVPRMARTPQPPGVRFIPCEPTVTRSVAVATTTPSTGPNLRALIAALQHAVETQ